MLNAHVSPQIPPQQSQSQTAALQPQTVQIEPKIVAQSPQTLAGAAADAVQSPQSLAATAGHFRSPRRNAPTVAGSPNAVNAPVNETAATVGDIDVNQNDVVVSTGADVDVNDDQANQLESNVVIADDGPVSQNTQNEPKTYAQFFKSDNLSSGINFVSTNTNNTSARTPTNNTNSFPSRTPTVPTEIRNDTAPNALAGANAAARTGPRPDSRPGQIRGTHIFPLKVHEMKKAFLQFGITFLSFWHAERRPSNANQFSDNHQLFLGNVPHHATEEELRVMFGRFGVIVDLRIHSKPQSTKVPGMRATPNYGFITYDDPESVQKCLSNMVRMHSPHQHPIQACDDYKSHAHFGIANDAFFLSFRNPHSLYTIPIILRTAKN